MTDILGIDVDAMTILTAIIAIETLVIIALTIRLLRKSSSGMEPIIADLFNEMLKKIPAAKATEEVYSELIEKKVDEKFEEIRKEIGEKMKAEISKETRRTDTQLKELQTSMERSLKKAITDTKHVAEEVKTKSLEDYVLITILDLARSNKMGVSVERIYGYMLKYRPVPIETLLVELVHLRNEGFVILPSKVEDWQDIGSEMCVELTEKGEKRAISVMEEVSYQLKEVVRNARELMLSFIKAFFLR